MFVVDGIPAGRMRLVSDGLVANLTRTKTQKKSNLNSNINENLKSKNQNTNHLGFSDCVFLFRLVLVMTSHNLGSRSKSDVFSAIEDGETPRYDDLGKLN